MTTTEDIGAIGVAGSSVKRFRLVVIAGPDAGAIVASTGSRLVVGTHASCQLVLDDSAVSRFHCEVTIVDDRAVVRDLGSRNGTLVDSLAILEAYLAPGAILAIGRTQLRFEIVGDRVTLPTSDRDRFGLLVGHSPPMRRVFAQLERAAATDSTVLLEGETGTGKEIAAESIHRESTRADAPFIVVDCGAVPKDLLESELFGHERGAFTGAASARAGAFVAAAGGTLFLDEIGELAPELQPKLLRALERREVKRVGSDHYQRVDVRVIAATNRNLRAEVNARQFRADLYYRLAVLEVTLPALRDRTDDFALLVENILAQLGATDRAEAAVVRGGGFLAELAHHRWPGNVRELRNYVERCLAMRARDPLPPLPTAEAADAPGAAAPAINVDEPFKTARERLLHGFEVAYLTAVLQRHGDNVTAAARAAGVDRIQFYRLLWRHGLR